MKKNTHKKDKKLHNFEEELHNSSDAELSWREAIDLSPEDEGESGSEIYYFTDGDGNSYSREFLAQELISDDHAAEDSLERKSSGELQKLKPGATDIVNLIQDAQDTPEQITLPAPKSGGRPLDVRISSEIAPDLFDKQESLQSSEVAAANKHVIIHLDEGESAVDNIQATPDDSTRAGEPLTLNFSQTELDEYVRYRSEGIAKKSKDWINRSSQAVWEMTEGEVSHNTMTRLRTFVLDRYTSADSHSKVLGFAVGFLRYLAQRHIDQRYLSFTLFLERPKSKKVKKALTERIITRKEISAAFQRIDIAQEGGMDPARTRNYRAFALLASYTGLRPSTIQRLTVGQFKAALNEEKPVLHVLAEQEKNRIEHYVPLHPAVVSAINEVLKHDFKEKDDATPLFLFHSFEKWLERQKIPLPRVRDPNKAHLWLSDFRKFAEQYGDVIGWDTTNRKYVLAHGMTGVDWEHYKHPLPEEVYDTYMKCWRGVELFSS